MADLTIHATVCHCSKDELTSRLADIISDHLAENRHPDGIAPAALAEDIVFRLHSGRNLLITGDDLG